MARDFFVTAIMSFIEKEKKNLSEAFIFRWQCISFLDEENRPENKYNSENVLALQALHSKWNCFYIRV